MTRPKMMPRKIPKKPDLHLLHWNQSEAEERAARIEKLGYPVTFSFETRQFAQRLREGLIPALFVIDLTRLPSHGRVVAGALAGRKAARDVPILFVGGQPEKVQAALDTVPRATASTWQELESGITRALASPFPAAPRQTPAIAGSGPLGKKLGLKPGMRVLLIGPPDGYGEIMASLGEDLEIAGDNLRALADIVFWFVRSLDDLDRGLGWFATRAAQCRVWIAWPKQAGALRCDLTLPVIRTAAREFGLVDYKIVSLDKQWSSSAFSPRR